MEETLDIQDVQKEIMQISKENKLFRFNLEKSKTNDVEKKKIIEEIIDDINNIKKEENINKMTDLEKNFYKQPWNKLNNDLKLNKITEYILENDLDEKEKISIINRFNSNQFKTSKYIDYDMKECKILHIK